MAGGTVRLWDDSIPLVDVESWSCGVRQTWIGPDGSSVPAEHSEERAEDLRIELRGAAAKQLVNGVG